MRLSDIKRDYEAIAEGDWVRDIPEVGDLALKVRGHSCSDVRDLWDALRRNAPKSDRHPDGNLKPSANDRISREVALQMILLDWDGVLNADDEPIPYSRDRASEILFNPDYRIFLDAVLWASTKLDRDSSSQKEDLSGN